MPSRTMDAGTMEMFPAFRRLFRFTHTGTLSANISWIPVPQPVASTLSPGTPLGMLEAPDRMVGEVRRLIVWSPVDPVTGAAEDLKYIQLTLDGQD